MNIALIIPPYDLIHKGYGSKRFIRGGFFPALGVGYLAAPLDKKGYDVKIIDCPPIYYQNEDVLRELLEFKPNVIGVSSLTAAKDEACSLMNFLKEKITGVPIIFGGAHATCFPEDVFKNVPNLDALVYGEGEKTFEEICDSIKENGFVKENIKGTWIKNKLGELIKNPPQDPILNLDDALMPAFHLYDYKIYKPLPLQYKKIPAANLITSRGCPWGRCTFCFESGNAAQKYRRYSPERAIEEIKLLVKNHGVKEIAFWDDNFLINEKWVSDFCDLLDKEGLKMPWSAYGRVNTVTYNMLRRAKESGLWCVFYGYETGNEDLLKIINKGATLEQAVQATKWTHDLGIDTKGSFMLALPHETPEKGQKTIDFAKKLDVTFAQFLLTFPEWGTPLYDEALKSGKFVWEGYHGRTKALYIPNGYKDAEEARKMQKRAYHSFYFRPRFIWKHFKRLRNPSLIRQYYEGLKYVFGVSF